jgi:asparagine synthase (glutamine-hydrolysing)
VGAFAYAIWDRDRRSLTLVRDPIGIRPLFWARTPAGVVAASEMKALQAHPDVSIRVNETRVAQYLVQQPGAPDATFYREIRRVRPGHRLVVPAGGELRPRRYWSIEAAPDLRQCGDDEIVNRFAEGFREAVRCRMDPDASTGVMLSGGLDSSSVAAVARTLVRPEGRLPTFSAVFPDLPERARTISDERSYVRDLAALPGIDASLVSMAAANPAEHLEATVAHLDRPPVIPNGYIYHALHRSARRAGVPVLLDGAEGDDTLSYGQGYLLELAASGRWARFGEVVRALVRRNGNTAAALFWTYGAPHLTARPGLSPHHLLERVEASREVGVPVHRVVWRTLLKPSLPGPLRERWNRWREPDERPAEATLLHPDLAHHLRTSEEAGAGAATAPVEPESLPRTDRDAHEQTFAGANDMTALVLEEVDHLGAHAGVEHRHPFYDVRLIEMCVGMPARLKLHDGWSRYVLREALQGVLPDPIRRRTDKADLSPNFHRNLFRDARPNIVALLDAPVLRPFIDRTALRDAIERSDAVATWHTLALARWLDHVSSGSGVLRDADPVPEPLS